MTPSSPTNKANFELSDQFPQQPGLCYLNHAAVSPWPKTTKEALDRFTSENVRIGAKNYPNWIKTENELRQLLKTLINAESTDEIALAKSTSEALSIIAYGISWQEGDEVLISDQEFPSNRIVWESLSKFGVRVVTVEINSEDPLGSFEEKITPQSRLISVSTVQYASGQKIDYQGLSRICEKHNILLCLDAIQSLGVVPFDQQKVNADFIVADGHKWMMAAEGLALMYVKAKHIQTLNLRQYGWHMVEHRGDYDRKEWQPATNATRFECGSPNMLGIHALHASLNFLLGIGISTISDALEQRLEYLTEKLEKIPSLTLLSPQEPTARAGIVTFRIEGIDHGKLYKELMGQDVICAHRGGGIRFSPAFYTAFETIDSACDRLQLIIAKLSTPI